MKTLSSISPMLAFALLLVGFSSSGQQGNAISFSNFDLARGINAPFFDSDGTTRLDGENYRASLYVGPVGTPPESLIRVGPAQPFRSAASAGYWQPVNIQIPGVAPNMPVLAQVRFWDTQGGTNLTFEVAQSSGAKIGFSAVLQVNLVSSGATPLTGLRSASLMPNDMRLQIVRGATNAIVTWTAPNGVLQQCSALGADWVDVTLPAESPYQASTDTSMFYRLRRR